MNGFDGPLSLGGMATSLEGEYHRFLIPNESSEVSVLWSVASL